MKAKDVIAGGAIAILSGAPLSAETFECGLEQVFTHTTKHSGTHRIYGDGGALFFTGPMAVNTDGAPVSYHPDDPWGSHKAINTICNGANAVLPDGRKLDFTHCGELIAAFNEARQGNWNTAGAPTMEFYGVAAHGPVPCVIQSGPYAGYFVSTTSLEADKSKDVCDPERYLNALEIPFSIYPGASGFTSRGVGKGDVVVYYNPRNEVIEYGVVGDRGPRWGLVEASVAFAKALHQRTDDPRSRKDTYRFGLKTVHALILPNESLTPPFTPENVRSRAKERFEAWGGIRRFKSCVETIGRRP